MRSFLLLVAVVCMSLANAQSVTWSEHVAPIIYSHCTNCHRPGEVGPFSLTNYIQAASWANMLKQVTAIRYMPPWKAEIGYQEYQHENYLTDDEIAKIAAWVDGGTPEGDPNLAPAQPVFPTGSQVGTPDMVVSFAQSYKHIGNNVDEYRYFVLPTNLAEDKDLIALEIRPGNSAVVHHTLVWQDTTGDAAASDAATVEYGYESGQGSAFSGLNGQLPGYVPGQKPQVYTQGLGMKLFKGADLKLQMHYAPTASDEWDSTSVNLFFAPQPVTRYVKSNVLIPLPSILTNGPFIIPANQVKEFHGQYTVPTNVSMIGIAPHMHKLGQHWHIFAVRPDGDTVNLININEWDFNWQGTFMFRQAHVLPQGSVIHASAKYDNTTNNINNPHSPPQSITWGEGTSDEMYYLPLLYLDYQTGDENLTFEDEATGIDDSKYTWVKDMLYPVAPNPTTGASVKAGFALASGSQVSLKLYNVNGQEVECVSDNQFYLPGQHTVDVNLSNLQAGVYSLLMETAGKKQAQRIVVAH